MSTIHQSLAQQGLVRPRADRIFGGVCAGLGRRFGLDPWPTRLLFILVLMVIPGSQIIIYPILWILMPSEESLYQPYAGQPGYPGQAGYQPQGYPGQPGYQPQGYQPQPGYPTNAGQPAYPGQPEQAAPPAPQPPATTDTPATAADAPAAEGEQGQAPQS